MRTQTKTPPANAEYLEGLTVETDLDHLFSKVELFWNAEDRLRIRIPNASPAVIEGVYLEGQGKDVNVKLARPLSD
jgi:hypothetical protein